MVRRFGKKDVCSLGKKRLVLPGLFVSKKVRVVRACRGFLFIKKPIVLCAWRKPANSIISLKKKKGDSCDFFSFSLFFKKYSPPPRQIVEMQ